MAENKYAFTAFTSAASKPAPHRLQKALEPLGFVDGMTLDEGAKAVVIYTDHVLNAAEKTALNNVVKTVAGFPDIVPFAGGCPLPTVPTPADLPSVGEMAGFGTCQVLILAPEALAVWNGTAWKQVALP